MAAPTPAKSQVLTPFFAERPAGGRGGAATGLVADAIAGGVALGVDADDDVAGTAEGSGPVVTAVGPEPAALRARSGPRVRAMSTPASTASTTSPAAAIAGYE